VSEALAPTGDNDKRPPKRSKSADGKPVPRKNARKSKKEKEMEKCSKCSMKELKLYSTDPRNGKKYCFHCHVLECCSYKPPKGGRACFNKKDDDSERCSKHPLEQEQLSSVISTSV